jgi:hypothetical protein
MHAFINSFALPKGREAHNPTPTKYMLLGNVSSPSPFSDAVEMGVPFKVMGGLPRAITSVSLDHPKFQWVQSKNRKKYRKLFQTLPPPPLSAWALIVDWIQR